MKKTEDITKIYEFKVEENIGKINLKDFTQDIYNAVIKKIPDEYKPFVSVEKDDFVIVTKYYISSDISKELCKAIAKTP